MKNPEIVCELKRIAAEHDGELRPSDVVEAARPESSPLHFRFEWNDSIAAESYRLWQARELIAVTVEYIGSGKEAVLSRVFVSLTSDREKDGGGYRSVESVMQDPDLRHQLLSDALAEMKRFQSKYKELRELASVFAEMQKIEAEESVAV